MRMWRVIDGVQFDACLPETIGNLRLLYGLNDPTLPIVCPFSEESRQTTIADYIVYDRNGWYYANDSGNSGPACQRFFPQHQLLDFERN